MIVSDDVSDGDNIDDRMECDEDCVGVSKGDSESAEGATLDGVCCNKLEATDNYFH
jgi:hypothetical protein